MIEPDHLQGHRIEHGEDQADDDLPAHEASDRVVDLPPESANGVAAPEAKPAIDRRDHPVPVYQEIDRYDRHNDEQREEREQGLPARPSRSG